MAFKKTSGVVTSLDDLYTAIRNFFLLIGWTQAHTGTDPVLGGTYYFYDSNGGESGSDDFYIGIRRYKYNDLLCGFQFNACVTLNTGNDFADQPDGFGTDCIGCHQYNQWYYFPISDVVDDGTAINYWFIGDKDFAHFLWRIGAAYQSNYLGLINSYWSRTDYPLPLIVTGGYTGRTENKCVSQCCCDRPHWHCTHSVVPYRGHSLTDCNWCCFMQESVYNFPFRERNITNDGWNSGGGGNTLRFDCCWDSVRAGWNMVSNFDELNHSTRSQGHVLHPIYIGSPSIWVLGELKYIYISDFRDLPTETTVYIGGDRYKIFVKEYHYGERSTDTSIAIRDYE